jgi:hypothetical protein
MIAPRGAAKEKMSSRFLIPGVSILRPRSVVVRPRAVGPVTLSVFVLQAGQRAGSQVVV